MDAVSAAARGGASMPLTVRCVGGDAATCALVRELVATAMPTATVWLEGPEMLVIDSGAAAECIVLAGAVGGESALDAARRLRAAGLSGTLVGIVPRREGALEAQARALGVRLVERESLARELPEAIADAAAMAAAASPALLELRRMQQLVAAGELTSRLQHALNNPLTALMAEAQLLEMEPLADEQRLAVSRMVELCRRLVGIVRQMDAPGAPHAPARGASAGDPLPPGVSRGEESAS
jgi:signal transduction histidine kinase